MAGGDFPNSANTRVISILINLSISRTKASAAFPMNLKAYIYFLPVFLNKVRIVGGFERVYPRNVEVKYVLLGK
jgi:hypothetical protein